jgi:hypothetical protein
VQVAATPPALSGLPFITENFTHDLAALCAQAMFPKPSGEEGEGLHRVCAHRNLCAGSEGATTLRSWTLSALGGGRRVLRQAAARHQRAADRLVP